MIGPCFWIPVYNALSAMLVVDLLCVSLSGMLVV